MHMTFNLLQPCTLALLYALCSSLPSPCILPSSSSHSSSYSLFFFLLLLPHIVLPLHLVRFLCKLELCRAQFPSFAHIRGACAPPSFTCMRYLSVVVVDQSKKHLKSQPLVVPLYFTVHVNDDFSHPSQVPNMLYCRRDMLCIFKGIARVVPG